MITKENTNVTKNINIKIKILKINIKQKYTHPFKGMS